MLTPQQSLTKRLSASNIQVDARSHEGDYREQFARSKELETHCKAGAQDQEAVYSPLGCAGVPMSQCKHGADGSIHRQIMLHRSQES